MGTEASTRWRTDQPSNRTKFHTSPGVKFLADRWFYDPTYLHRDRRDVTLFVRRIAVTETMAGNRRARHGFDVWEFPSTKEMHEAIRQNNLERLPDEALDDRQWIPDDLRKMVDR